MTWTSSNENAVKTDGTVVFGEERQEVKLTAEITCGSYSETCEYTVTVPSQEEAQAGIYRSQLLIPRYVSEDLQQEADGQGRRLELQRGRTCGGRRAQSPGRIRIRK